MRRTAAEYIRSLEMRIARLEKLSRAPLAPLKISRGLKQQIFEYLIEEEEWNESEIKRFNVGLTDQYKKIGDTTAFQLLVTFTDDFLNKPVSYVAVVTENRNRTKLIGLYEDSRDAENENRELFPRSRGRYEE